MRKHGKHRNYTEEDILVEAKEYLKDDARLVDVAKRLCMPLSTLSWHLLHPLRDIDFALWAEVRTKTHKFKRTHAKCISRKRWGK